MTPELLCSRKNAERAFCFVFSENPDQLNDDVLARLAFFFFLLLDKGLFCWARRDIMVSLFFRLRSSLFTGVVNRTGVIFLNPPFKSNTTLLSSVEIK